MWAKNTKQSAFTIVELLIVITVIAVLAAITVVAYTGIHDRAKNTKINSDVSTLIKAVNLARQNNSANLGIITGSNASGANCWNKASGTDLATLPDTDLCIVSYNNALNAISNASGANVRNIRDPWGRPYLIDENEGENGTCVKDSIGAFKQPFTTAFGLYPTTPGGNVAFAGFSGCN